MSKNIDLTDLAIRAMNRAGKTADSNLATQENSKIISQQKVNSSVEMNKKEDLTKEASKQGAFDESAKRNDSILVVEDAMIKKENSFAEIILSNRVAEFYEIGSLVYVTPLEFLISAIVFVVDDLLDQPADLCSLKITVDTDQYISIENIKKELKPIQSKILDVISSDIDIIVSLNADRLAEVDDSILDRNQIQANKKRELDDFKQEFGLKTEDNAEANDEEFKPQEEDVQNDANELA